MVLDKSEEGGHTKIRLRPENLGGIDDRPNEMDIHTQNEELA